MKTFLLYVYRKGKYVLWTLQSRHFSNGGMRHDAFGIFWPRTPSTRVMVTGVTATTNEQMYAVELTWTSTKNLCMLFPPSKSFTWLYSRVLLLSIVVFWKYQSWKNLQHLVLNPLVRMSLRTKYLLVVHIACSNSAVKLEVLNGAWRSVKTLMVLPSKRLTAIRRALGVLVRSCSITCHPSIQTNGTHLSNSQFCFCFLMFKV